MPRTGANGDDGADQPIGGLHSSSGEIIHFDDDRGTDGASGEDQATPVDGRDKREKLDLV